MELLNLENVFFEALNYPEYARPNFFIIKQKESPWAKGIYLATLSEVYHACNTWIEFRFRANKRNNPDLKIEDIAIPIKEFTKKEQSGTFNKKMIDELYLSVRSAYYFDRPSKQYSAIEILSFAEYALLFIRQEFKEQINAENSALFRPRTNNYFIYHIAQDAPFFNFPKFKHAYRELLFTVSNTASLKELIKKYYVISTEIVRLWNKKLYFIEDHLHSSEEQVIPKMVNVEFSADELKHSWWTDTRHFDILSPQIFRNQNFASFAANIANTIASDFSAGKLVTVREAPPDFISDFLLGIKLLLRKSDRVACIQNIKAGLKLEEPFRDWFTDWFEAKNYATNEEPLKGNGHIDLKVEIGNLGTKIIEFKGWWNSKKKGIIQQVCNYLTQFEGDGYIFMVNHTRKSIVADYKKLVTTKDTGYLLGSWKIEKTVTAFQYYKTKHRLGPDEKELHHFIISIY